MIALSKAHARRLTFPLGCPFLVGIEIENVRGFRKAKIDLTSDLIVFVGPNNSGKTSLFRILDWALNRATEETLSGQVDLSAVEKQLLIPARNTRGSARRIVLLIELRDRRRHARFSATDGIVRLRFRVLGDRVYLKVRPPARSELHASEKAAIELLREVRASTDYRYVPATREVGSGRFGDTLATALEARLSERAVHQARAGAPGEYREVKHALETLTDVAENLAAPLWEDVQKELIPSLSRGASLKLAVDPPSLVRWMAQQLELKIVTGEHDPNAVYPVEVGSGLQSLLDLAMFRGEAVSEGTDPILAIEEPEAFLHPTAQRTLARRLVVDDSIKRLVSTHSPIFVEEASYANIALVRDHVVYQPRTATTNRARIQINSALLAGQGAEMAFSRGVLLVEGEGDKLFFESIRRRVAPYDKTGRLDELTVVWVGSNTLFAPWMRLLEGFATDNVRPIEWLVIADSADSSPRIRRAFRDAQIRFSPGVTRTLARVEEAARTAHDDVLVSATRRFNRATTRVGTRTLMLPIDLEFAMLSEISVKARLRITKRIGVTALSRDELLQKLGSKYDAGPVSKPLKAPWVRAAIGELLPLRELSLDTRHVLQRWFRMVLDDQKAVNSVMRAAGIKV